MAAEVAEIPRADQNVEITAALGESPGGIDIAVQIAEEEQPHKSKRLRVLG